MSVQNNVSKLMGNHKLESGKRNEASEETNESSSEDGNEDSSDNRTTFKPKPGKLDLSQFDNITNAIGKLNVQAPIRISEINNTGSIQARSAAFQQQYHQRAQQQQQFHHNLRQQASTEGDLAQSQYSGFFKGKSKTSKSKSRVKESPQRGKSTLAEGNNNDNEKDQSRDEYSGAAQTAVIKRPPACSSSNLAEPKIEQKSRSNSTPGSSSFLNSTTKTSVFHSTQPPLASNCNFKVDQQYNSNITNIEPPKPAPRTSHSSNAKKSISPTPTPATATTTTSTFSVANATSPSITTTSAISASLTGPKRLCNPRQNHGRAVAPPQLPESMRVEPVAMSSKRLDSERPSYEVIAQLTGDDGAIDYSQSPIAQRLLGHTKDYKVSELNSPYDSDCEHPQSSVNLIRVQKLQRGQSFISENSSPMYVNSSIDSSELINSRGAAIRQLNEILSNKQPLGRPGGQKLLLSRGASTDKEYNFLDDTVVKRTPVPQPLKPAKDDKEAKKDKKKSRDDEKLEKRRLKEEERVRRQEKKLASKRSSKLLNSYSQVDAEGIPLFIRRCIEFIEFVGLDAEGIYRVPGNRAHVDAFVQKFKENSNMSMVDADIPVNAVATALKDFLSKKWDPIIPAIYMNELTDLSHISDTEQRTRALRHLIKRLPPPNYNLLKYVFSHFVKVSLNHSFNSMDSKNLAICWWPTLLPLSFSDMVMFEQMRPHLEETIQTLIDRYDYIFDSDEPAS